MRQELNRIEEAVQYLNDQMSAPDRLAYAQGMNENPEKARVTEEVRLLETAIKRRELRARIESHASGSSGKMYLISGIFLLILAAIFTLTQIKSFHESEIQHIEKEQQKEGAIEEETVAEETAPVSAVENDEHADAPITLGGQELWVAPDVQTFRFDSRKGAVIEGKQGMLIIVPADGFTDRGGEVLTGPVEFRLVEAMNLEDMVLYKLQTVSGGAPLESGGMFHIEAAVDGQQAEINPTRPLYIEIPAAEVKAGMMAFKGEVKDGKINWTDPAPLQKFLVQIPLDSLDFLPPGFEAEVKNHMPFKQHTRASQTLVDSLYYALPNQGQTTESSPSAGSDRLIARDGEAMQDACGIHPHTIETIKSPDFNQSFIATHEFESRIQALHTSPDGEELLQLYIRHLDKNLWEADQTVAAAASGDTKSRFESFAGQRLTRVEDGALYAAQLSAHYRDKRFEISTYRKKLAAQISEMNQKELDEIRNKLRDFDRNSSDFPTPPGANPGNGSVYATTWYTMGWGNIDLYLKDLRKGTESVKITVNNRSENAEVSQWLGEINTYTNLTENDGSYRAVFPKKRRKNQDTWVFALSGKGREFKWAFRAYNPSEVNTVEMTMTAAAEEDIRRDLKQVGERFGRIQSARIAQQRAAERLIASQIFAQERAAAKSAKRQAMLDALSDVKRKQRSTAMMMEKLMEIGYPCGKTEAANGESDQNMAIEEQIFTIVEDMPQFVGGEAALRRYLNRSLKYPKSAADARIEGAVFVTFVVEPDGSITGARVIRSIHPECDAAALEAVNNMPAWRPGRQRGTAVKVQYNLPIRFTLQ